MSANQLSQIKPKVEGRMIEKHYIGTADIGSSFDFSKKIRKTSQRKSPKVQISAETTLRESSNGHAVKTDRLSLVLKGGSPASNLQRERKSSATRQMIGRNDTFEQSYSKIRRFIGRLSSSGGTSKKSTVSTKLRTNETCRDNQTGSLYGVDASPIDMDNISPGHKYQSTPVYSEGSNKVKRSFTDQDALSPLEMTRISQIEAKLAFVLSKMNLRNCDKLSKESLENIKVAIEAEQAIQREENQVMFVSLERENQSLQAKAQQLNEECEQQRRMHMETLQKMEKQIIRLDDQVSDMQKIIGDQDRTITECNGRLKKHMLGEVSPSAVQDLVKRPQATSKSIFEDFDGIFKSLLSDIKAKEKFINDLEKSRVSAPKENIKSDFSHLVKVNSGLKSFQSNQSDSLISDVQQLQEQMRNIVVKHGKDMKNMEVQFQQEIKALKCIHNDEKKILQIKVKSLEKELSDPKGPSYSGISEELNALNRKYKASVAEINHLRTKVGIMQKDKNRKSSNGELSSEHELLTVGSNSKNKASLLSSGLPQPILAESANAFANITEESPSTLRTMAEGLLIREGNLTAKEQEILKKEVEVNQRINHIEEYTRHAEEQINQKVNEINEAEIEIDQKKKKLKKFEQELFTRERTLKGLNSLVPGDERDHDQSTEARNSNTESNKIEKNDALKSEKSQSEMNKQAIEHMKEQMHIMSNNVVDLEKNLLAERMEKERDRYQAAQVRKEFERAKATIETLTDQLSKMGVAPKVAVLPHVSNSGRPILIRPHPSRKCWSAATYR